MAFIRLLFVDPVEEKIAHRWAERLAHVVGSRVIRLRPGTSLDEMLQWGAEAGARSMHFVSRPSVKADPKTKAVFLVYAYVPKWRSLDLPRAVVTETELAGFLESKLHENTLSPFLVRGTALAARYHIQNYTGKAEELTHEAHDRAKVFFELTNAPVELVGFFTSREGDAGTFVHMGQTTHIHLMSKDRRDMGHLESVRLAAGAHLLLPDE